MRNVVAVVVLVLLLGAMPSPTVSLGQTPSYSPAQNYSVRIRDVEYRRDGNNSWLARIYEPEGAGLFPMLLDVHGGIWSLADRNLDALIDQALATSGIVVVAIDFRQAPQHPYPASVADVNYATRWLKAHARDFKADPRTIGGLGMSSGGHLIVLSAMRPRDPRYNALPLSAGQGVDASLRYIIALYPVLDPHSRYLFAQRTNRTDLVTAQDGYFQTVQAMQEGNPTLILERGERVEHPPMLLLQGTADRNVTPQMQRRFATAYRAAGGSIELITFPDTPHGFTLSRGPDTDRAITLMKEFIARQLGGY